MKRLWAIFEKITQIPHCSGHTEKLRDYIHEFAYVNRFETQIDEAGNILVRRGKSNLALQAHYDMVCVGDAPEISLRKSDGFLSAQNSSLGADNGIAIAMMLRLIEMGFELEYLFTNDEEIGLIGANNLALELEATHLINLDSEEEDVICIGCAGGVDILVQHQLDMVETTYEEFYEISAKGFMGGHSGIDIDKGSKNAIVELAHFIGELKEFDLIEFSGGERRNSIPVKAKALIATNVMLKSTDAFDVKKSSDIYLIGVHGSKEIIELIKNLPNGVIERNEEFDVVQKSANLGLAHLNKDLHLQLSLRAMGDADLETLSQEIQTYLNAYHPTQEGFYPSWIPQITQFTKRVQATFKRHGIEANTEAIHAGLETAIFSKRFEHLEIVSIGPNIYNPHSTRERVQIASVDKIWDILLDIVEGEVTK